MADKKTSQFNTISAAQLSDSDYIPVVDVSEPDPALKNKRILISELKIALGTSAGGGGNTTPSAPTVTADDTANTLSASHALGTSEIVVSENNGAYLAYAGQISVGDVARPQGYWKFKIKAAAGRNESAVAESPAFTLAGPSALHESQFTGANGTLLSDYTPEIGNAWVDQSGSVWEIQNNSAVGKTADGSSHFRTVTDVGTSASQTVEFLATKGVGTDYLGFYLKYTNSSNHVYVVLGTTTNYLVNVVGGVETTIVTTNTAGVSDTQEHTYIAVVNGNDVSVTIDGNLAISGTVPAGQTGTQCGMFMNGAPGSTKFNSFGVV